LLRHLRQMGSDAARALVVVALVFLSFAHTPGAAAAHAGNVLTAAVDSSFCGGLPAGDGAGHAPCHACRIGGGADLPPPPCLPEAAPVAAAPVSYVRVVVRVAAAATHDSARPRAPPALV